MKLCHCSAYSGICQIKALVFNKSDLFHTKEGGRGAEHDSLPATRTYSSILSGITIFLLKKRYKRDDRHPVVRDLNEICAPR